MSAELVEGRVKWWNQAKGFGFLQMPGASLDIFMHANQLRKSGVIRAPIQGERFKFCVETGPKGAFAINLSPIEG